MSEPVYTDKELATYVVGALVLGGLGVAALLQDKVEPAPYYAQPGCHWVKQSSHALGVCDLYEVRVDDRVVADFHHGEAAQAFIRNNGLRTCAATQASALSPGGANRAETQDEARKAGNQ